MLRQATRGATPALVCCIVAIFGIFNALGLVPIAAGFLLLWLLFSLFRLIQETAKRSYKQSATGWGREQFSFWLGAVLSCLVAPLVYGAIGALVVRGHSTP